jgi:Kdo2-lipid IVA 3' secondary acyltransferase
VRVEYSRALRFKTWDAFLLPLPFSRVKVIFEPVVQVPRRMDEEAFEQQRLALQNVLGSD